MSTNVPRIVPAVALGALILLFSPASARAHCDTLSGPVVAAARVALDRGDLAPVLRWVKPAAEPELRRAFAQALEVRAQGRTARDLADRFFFETVVRLHRAGEGAPYTGLKEMADDPHGTLAGADAALDGGSADALVRLVTEQVSAGIRERFARVLDAKKHANESVEAGRAFVEAYVEYVHYVEGVAVAQGGDEAHAETATPPTVKR